MQQIMQQKKKIIKININRQIQNMCDNHKDYKDARQNKTKIKIKFDWFFYNFKPIVRSFVNQGID